MPSENPEDFLYVEFFMPPVAATFEISVEGEEEPKAYRFTPLGLDERRAFYYSALKDRNSPFLRTCFDWVGLSGTEFEEQLAGLRESECMEVSQK